MNIINKINVNGVEYSIGGSGSGGSSTIYRHHIGLQVKERSSGSGADHIVAHCNFDIYNGSEAAIGVDGLLNLLTTNKYTCIGAAIVDDPEASSGSYLKYMLSETYSEYYTETSGDPYYIIRFYGIDNECNYISPTIDDEDAILEFHLTTSAGYYIDGSCLTDTVTQLSL